MTFVPSGIFRYLPFAGALFLLALFSFSSAPQAQAQDEEPIAYIGHGAFFDWRGQQIVPTTAWVARAQSWYRRQLTADLPANLRGEFAAFERQLAEGLDLSGQDRLVVQQRALGWLAARLPRTVANGRLRSILNALDYRLNWRLARSGSIEELLTLEPFRLNPRVEERLRLPQFRPGRGPAALVTTKSAQDYLDECAQANVPIPPAINVENGRAHV